MVSLKDKARGQVQLLLWEPGDYEEPVTIKPAVNLSLWARRAWAVTHATLAKLCPTPPTPTKYVGREQLLLPGHVTKGIMNISNIYVSVKHIHKPLPLISVCTYFSILLEVL